MSCSLEKKGAYICGDRECLDKKEIEEYFSKNLSVEVSFVNKAEKNESLNLVKLNTNSEKSKKKSDILITEKKKTSNFKKKEKKRELEKKRKLAKLKKLEKRKKIKRERKTAQLKSKKINKNLEKTKKLKEKKETKKTKEFCLILEECDIDQISDYFIKIGKEKNYPDITKK